MELSGNDSAILLSAAGPLLRIKLGSGARFCAVVRNSGPYEELEYRHNLTRISRNQKDRNCSPWLQLQL